MRGYTTDVNAVAAIDEYYANVFIDRSLSSVRGFAVSGYAANSGLRFLRLGEALRVLCSKLQRPVKAPMWYRSGSEIYPLPPMQ